MRRVLKFSASWCNPCKVLAKTLKEVQTELPIEEYDIDENEIMLENSISEVCQH